MVAPILTAKAIIINPTECQDRLADKGEGDCGTEAINDEGNLPI